MVPTLRSPSREEDSIDSSVHTPFDESKRHLAEPEAGDKVRLRTLGDGPCAPEAVDEAAEANEGEPDIEVSPGYKGWINLVGVSRMTQLKHLLISRL